MKRFMKVVATTLCAGMVLSSGLFVTSPVVMAAGGVAINSTNFPDENFREYVKKNCDTNGDGVLSQGEIDSKKYIDVSVQEIKSLKGIEYFTALTDLHCENNQLTTLDVSKNVELWRLNCSKNQLTSLDVSKNIGLTYLYCYINQLTSLDVSKNVALCDLECDSNQLTSLDVSKNVALTELYFVNNQLTSLDVSKNVALTRLWCYNNQLTSLDVSKNVALTELYCYNNQLTSLDVSKNVALTRLWCSGNQLTSLDVSKNTNLHVLDCYGNQLTSLDVSKNANLDSLDCEKNQLTSLDVSKNTELGYLYCNNNQLTSLDVSKNTELEYLYCNNNQLTSLDVSKNTELGWLECNNNQLTSLDVSKNTKLWWLECNNNQLTSLDVSKNVALSSLYCSDNQLTSLDVSKNTNLCVLDCYGNQLTSLDVSKNTELEYLYCNNNQLTSLDVSKNANLEELACQKNKLSTLDISNNKILVGYCAEYEIRYEIHLENEDDKDKDIKDIVAWGFMYGYDYERFIGLIIEPSTLLYANGKEICKATVTSTPTSAPTSVPTAGPIPTAAPTTVPEQSVGSFVDRCYEVALGRAADEEGFKYWLEALNNGKICGAQAGYGFIFSGEYINKNRTNEEFVTDLYTMYFGRTPDSEGFNYWVGLLNSGTDREEIFAGFANSLEFDNLCAKYGVVTGAYIVGVPNDQQGGVNSFVARLYQVCLNRLPDMGGQAGWVQKLIAGEVTGTTCSYGFVFSPEFIGKEPSNEEFVAYMYRAFFGREADEAGFTAWVETLNNGGSYEDVFNGFTGSAEFANLCASYGIQA